MCFLTYYCVINKKTTESTIACMDFICDIKSTETAYCVVVSGKMPVVLNQHGTNVQ